MWTKGSYSRVTWCVSVERNGCGRGLGSAKIQRFCIFLQFNNSLEFPSKGPLSGLRLGWLHLSNTIWVITVHKHHVSGPLGPEDDNNVKPPAKDRSLRSGVDRGGVWQLSSWAQLLFSSGSCCSVSLLSNGKGKSVSSSGSDDDLLVSKVAIWGSADALSSFINVLSASASSLEFCKEDKWLNFFCWWTEESTGSFSCESEALMSSDSERIENVSRKETLLVLPGWLPSSKGSLSVTLILLFLSWTWLAFFCLDFRKCKKSEKVKETYRNMIARLMR